MFKLFNFVLYKVIGSTTLQLKATSLQIQITPNIRFINWNYYDYLYNWHRIFFICRGKLFIEYIIWDTEYSHL